MVRQDAREAAVDRGRLGRPGEATAAYNAAIERVGNETERSLLIGQRDSLD
jgi:predicted RNA polymerase sigma factor